MRRSCSILISAASVLVAGPALAQATPDGAVALQKGLAAVFQPAIAGQAVEGVWAVEPAGAAYRITGPAISFSIPGQAGGEVRIRCDADHYLATPPAPGATAAGLWRLSADTPQRCEIQPPGEEPVVITSADRRATIDLDLDRSLVLASSDRRGRFSISQKGGGQATIDQLRLTSTAVPEAGSPRREMVAEAQAEGTVIDLGAEGHFTIGRMGYRTRIDSVDVPGLIDWVQAMQRLTRQAEEQKLPEETVVRQVWALMAQAVTLAGPGAESELTLADLDGRVAEDNTTLQLDSLALSGGYSGFAPDAKGAGLGADLRLELTGLATNRRWLDEDAQGWPSQSVSIGRLRLAGRLAPGENGAGSAASGDITVDNLSVFDPSGLTNFTLQGGRYRVALDGIDVPAIADLVQAVKDAVDRPEPDIRGLRAAITGGLETIGAKLQTYRAEFLMAGFDLNLDSTRITIQSVGTGEHDQGLNGDAGTGRYVLGLRGLKVDPLPPMGGWIPQDAAIIVSLQDAPFRSLSRIYWSTVIDDAFGTVLLGETPNDMAALKMVMDMVGVLRQSKANLTIDQFQITAPSGSVTLDGSAHADQKAAWGVVADGGLHLAGLKTLIRDLKAEDADAELVAWLSALQAIGRPGAEDPTKREYEIKIDPAGRALINGTDVTAIGKK